MKDSDEGSAMVDAKRVVAELKELRRRTGDEGGAQRVAFTAKWAEARAYLREILVGTGVEVYQDAGGNLHAVLRGESERELLIGGHLDSVPNGGWLDGCLNVLAGVEVVRRMAREGRPRVTVRLVDWADEEGARFGRSLFGSSAASGSLVAEEVRGLVDKEGVRLPDAIGAYGIELDRAVEAKKELKNAAAYLELHIEQGPVLESLGLPMGVVLGTFGVERHAVTFVGQAAHSGSTPMGHRKDALGGVSKLHLAVREIAVKYGGVCTVGSVVTRPGIVTAVVGEAVMTLDQRHLEAGVLGRMYAEAREASERIAREEKIGVEWKKIWAIQPFLFDSSLIAMGEEAIKEVCGAGHRLPSGPLHDAAEVCRAGIPTVMLFVQSLRGISHNKIEDTLEEHIEMSVRVLDRLAEKTVEWIGEEGR